MGKAYKRIILFLGSNKFFYVIIAFFIFQALWMAFSFRYPSPYDEQFHFEVIQVYSHQLSPIIVNQSHAYDHLRDLTHESSHFYHFLMSFPYRLIAAITSNSTAQIVLLRLINVGLAAWGIIMFGRLFRFIRIRQIYINIGLLFFCLLPIVPQVSSIINYDNLLLPLTAWYLLICSKILLKPKTEWREYAGIIILGTLTSLVKYTFLPIFAVSLIYLAIFLYRRGIVQSWNELVASLRKDSKFRIGILGTLAIVLTGLFVQLYIQNVLRYGTPQPTCIQTMSEERCRKSAIEARNLDAEKTKAQRPLQSPEQYSLQWYQAMQYTTDLTFSSTTTGARVNKQPLPIFYALTFFGSVIALAIIIYSWSTLSKNQAWYFLATVSLTLIAVVFLNNYNIYRQFHWAIAIQPRYFLNVVPVGLVLAAVATGHALQKNIKLEAVTFIIVTLLALQGGGIITHILSSDDSWYWQNRAVIKANHAVKKILSPLVKE